MGSVLTGGVCECVYNIYIYIYAEKLLSNWRSEWEKMVKIRSLVGELKESERN